MTTKFLSLLEKHGLDAHREALMGLGKESIELIKSQEPIVSGCSKLGGTPDLPSGFEWPTREHGPYSFFGQIRLSELPRVSTVLPEKGLLSFFYFQDDGSGHVSWHDPYFVRAFLFAEDAELESRPAPEGVYGSEKSSRLRFEASFDLPQWPEDTGTTDWPLDEEIGESYWELRESLNSGLGHLLGFSYNNSFSYDPAPGPGWISLLTLNSALGFCWHDGDWLVTFIEPERALRGDFSEVRSDAG